MSTVADNFTTVVHHKPYATILPSRAQLSQKGKVVLVTGSSGGIGFAIARAFSKASTAKVILTGRHQGPLDTTIDTLKDLPGHYAVWAASDEAKFLHRRFTWAAWDVNKISSGKIRERIDGDANYLKVGVTGL
ncbi:uncharacterized protein N7458_012593 [Penicillium daleae]|uniref:Uncharacterized protein n=1 Tax=Penicillium daleae TaxID=63821 RepID=A0AAD6BY17_9EURO|nr:uncharacterized protein N7458_012593 [Penicillium daleae]KAJ5433437.1 hypothetical protein N7458_012593 [Penicillium daleae]